MVLSRDQSTIDQHFLLTWGAMALKFKKNEVIFNEGDMPRYFYQIVKGSVKMQNTGQDGKDFTQGIFMDGSSFGEPPLFLNLPYPASAVTTKETTLLRLPREVILRIMNEHPDLTARFLLILSKRLYDKTRSVRDLMNHTPEYRILSFLTNYKKELFPEMDKIVIPFTRQEIANFTGIRVETAIRTITKLAKEKKLEIINRKILI